MVEGVGGGVDLVVVTPFGEIIQLGEELGVPVGLQDGDPTVVAGGGEVERSHHFPAGYRRRVNPAGAFDGGEQGFELGDHHLPGGSMLLLEQLVSRPNITR